MSHRLCRACVVLTVAWLTVLGAGLIARAAEAAKPNVVIIYTDDK